MTKRSVLIKGLDRVTFNVATKLAAEAAGKTVDAVIYTIGTTQVIKNTKGLYNIKALSTSTVVYSDLSVYDAAVIIAQKVDKKQFTSADKMAVLESVFVKHHTDMIYYLHCYKLASKRKDYSRMYILEDKFQHSEILAKSARNNIALFKT